MTNADFGTWLFKQLDHLTEIHLSFRDEQGWLSPQRVLDSDWEVYTFEIDKTKSQPALWNEVYIEADDLGCTQWARYTFSLGEEENSSKLETKLLIEVPADTDPVRERVESEITLTKSSIEDLIGHEIVQPVPAGRVAGLDSQKHELRQFLRMTNEDWGLSDRTGILLEGPPGTGKTELVIETCQELYDSMPVTISGPEILSKWVGESERLLRKKFEEAQNTESGVLYIDEIDAIARSRSEASQEHSAQLVAQLLVLLDGVEAKSEAAPKVVASTNLSEVIDSALLRPGRLGNDPISFPRPNPVQRQAIIHHYVEQIRTSNSSHLSLGLQKMAENPTKSSLLRSLARETDGYTGADIEDIFIKAAAELQSSEKEGTLEESTVLTHIQERDIQPAGSIYSDYTIGELEVETQRVTLGDEGNIIALDSDDEMQAKRVACAWNDKIESPNNTRFRSLAVPDLIAQDKAGTRDRIVEVFQRHSDDRLCLYISNFSTLIEMQGRTALVDVALETIHEELLRWGEDHLFVHGTSSEQEVSQPLAGKYRCYTSQ